MFIQTGPYDTTITKWRQYCYKGSRVHKNWYAVETSVDGITLKLQHCKTKKEAEKVASEQIASLRAINE